jgi:hypothetical protein
MTDEKWRIAKLGIGLTLIMSYALPGLLLALGSPAGPDWYKGMMNAIKDAIKNRAVIGTLAALGVFVETAISFAAGTPDNGFTKEVLKFAGNKGGQFIIDKGAEWLFPEVVKLVAKKSAEKAIPFAGWVLYAAESVGSIAEMVETTVECIMSPWVNQNGVTFTHDVQVTILPDTKHPGSFPASATKYTVTLHVDGKNDRVIERSLANPAVGQIVETFTAVPMGGNVKASVAFYSTSDWLAGQGETTFVPNVTSAGVGILVIPAFNIKEQPVPLTLDSVYAHHRRLGFDGVSHQWIQTAAPPAATRFHLSCSSAPGSLCELHGITVSQMAAVLGYSWKASGQGVNDCTTGGAASQLSTLQNVSIGANPDDSLLFTACGFLDRPNVVYSLLADASGNHFYIDPRSGEFHVRKMDLSATGTLAPSAGQSYGKFSLHSDSLVCYKNYIISVNRLKSKLEILEMPGVPFADEEAPLAAIVSGEGNRQGLLHHPVAVATDSKGTVYVLEEQNTRVQAFDVHGNPLGSFADGAYSFVLRDEGGLGVRYLDMGVEYSGYIYVLSYTGDGAMASDYHLDIYTPEGSFLVRTPSFVAGRIAVDYWRNVFSLNYETFFGPGGRTEPVVSQWMPPAPSAMAALGASIVTALRKGTRTLFLS